MESILPTLLSNIHWIVVIAAVLISATVMASHKQRRQKKLAKVLKRHGVLDNQQRFQN